MHAGEHVRRRLLGVAAVVVLLVTAGAAGSARAYVIGARPWPGHVITYHNTLRADARAVAAAVHDWNHSGAHVRLIPAPARRAEVMISKMPRGFSTAHLPGRPHDQLRRAGVRDARADHA